MGFFRGKNKRTSNKVELGPELFRRISSLLSAYPGEEVNTTGIAYFSSPNSEKQSLDIVGESFCQENIKENFKLEKWIYGLLIPEQENKSDPNAVALYLINKDFGVVRVGYLKKEIAKKVSQKVANIMVNEGLVIPVLAIIKPGPEESSKWGVRAFAMTDKLSF